MNSGAFGSMLHYENWDGPFYFGVRHPMYPQILWDSLRGELDNARMFLDIFLEFVRRTTIGDAFYRVEEKVRRHIARIELVEERLRDQLSIIGSAKGIEMAELSIQESKRVMLCKVPCFLSWLSLKVC